jgi:hypothetical protein
MSVKSRWEQYKEKNGGVTPLDFLNPDTKYATKDFSDTRFAICEVCPSFIRTTTQCKECGCFMKLKTKLVKAACPLGKW